jgi:hypothetical protein
MLDLNFQKNSNEAFLLGGNNYKKIILTVNLTTGAYTKAPKEFINPRYRSACALGSKGEVYIAGGYGPAKGLEVWDPNTGNVQIISPELPPEAGSTGITFAIDNIFF